MKEVTPTMRWRLLAAVVVIAGMAFFYDAWLLPSSNLQSMELAIAVMCFMCGGYIGALDFKSKERRKKVRA